MLTRQNWYAVNAMSNQANGGKIRVALLDDHPVVIEGLLSKLSKTPQIEVVGTADNAAELESLLADHPADVLILDVRVPTAPDNDNPYPILHFIRQRLDHNPDLAILILSMSAERALIEAILDAGANGYILKNDRTALDDLGTIVLWVARGDFHLSKRVREILDGHRKESRQLSPRQLEALSLAASHPEWPESKLAKLLNITGSGVRNLLSQSYKALGVSSRVAGVAKAQQLGMITPLTEDPHHE